MRALKTPGRRCLIAMFAGVVVLALPALASAAPRQIGISDQFAGMFANRYFKELSVPTARLVVSWDAVMRRTSEVRIVDVWLRSAAYDGVEPLIAFNHTRGCYDSRGHVPHRAKCRLPSQAAYRRAFLAFRRRYPQVTDFSPWNEANHRSQPTSNAPRSAAGFYNTVRANCLDCRVIAAEVLDQPGMVSWLRQFRRYARGRPRLWGLHNYFDINNHSTAGTRSLLRAVRGQVWLTETGGIVKFTHLHFNPARAARSIRFMFRLAGLSPRIARVYVYNWTGSKRRERFDAGLIGPDGRPRPGYYVLRRHLLQRMAKPAPTPTPTLPPAPIRTLTPRPDRAARTR